MRLRSATARDNSKGTAAGSAVDGLTFREEIVIKAILRVSSDVP